MSEEYSLKNSLEALLEDIGMPGEVADAVLAGRGGCSAARTWADSKVLVGDGGKAGSSMPGLQVLREQLTASVENRTSGVWRRFPEDVFIATMGCFSRFVREHFDSYGYYGFDRDFWTTRQVNAKLFRIGELEYEIVNGDEIADGDEACISLHIPSDAVMKPDALNESLDRAKAFFAEFFPGKENCAVCCESWLLAPKLKSLLPDDSNINGVYEAALFAVKSVVLGNVILIV